MAKIKILDSQIPEHNNSVGWHLLLLLPHCHAQEQPQKKLADGFVDLASKRSYGRGESNVDETQISRVCSGNHDKHQNRQAGGGG
jgi:hypothetical protein